MKRFTKRGMIKEEIGKELGLKDYEPLPGKLWLNKRKELAFALKNIKEIKAGQLSEQQLGRIEREVAPEEIELAAKISKDPKLKRYFEDKIKFLITRSIVNEIKREGSSVEGAADILNADADKRARLEERLDFLIRRRLGLEVKVKKDYKNLIEDKYKDMQALEKKKKVWTAVSTAVSAGIAAASVGAKEVPAWSEWRQIHGLPEGFTELIEHPATNEYFVQHPLVLAVAFGIPLATYWGMTAKQMVLSEAGKIVHDKPQFNRYLQMIEEEERKRVGYLEKQVDKSKQKGRI